MVYIYACRFGFLLGAWLLAAMVLVNCYSSTIIAYLTVPMINTLEDLTVHQDIDIVVWEETIIGQIILVRSTVRKLKVG